MQFRVTGTQTWQNALPLFRVHPETVAGYTVAPQFAGTIFDLRPGTTYDIQLHAVDPDGLNQTWTLTATTRKVPGDPATPRIVNVNSSGTLASALNAAQAGDIITLANGVYPGTFQISKAGTPANPIVIRGASEDGVVIDGGNCTNCNIFDIYGAGYVYLERMTLQNAERAVRYQWNNATGNVIRRVHVKNTSLGIGGQLNQFDFYIADNIFEGRLAWPHVYSDDNGTFASQDGIAVWGFGHVVTHNRISGYGDAMKTIQDGARANDFYGNDILYTYDNGIELDGSEGNTRCFRNRFMNTFSPLSVQPIHGGPTYILRNVVVNIAGEQLKFHSVNTTPPQDPSGILVYNNTFVSPPNVELNMQTPASSHYFEVENNLFIAPPSSGPEAADWTGTIDHGTFDYNGYFPNGIFRFNNPLAGGYFFQPNFAGLQGLGMEQHGLIAGGALFASGLAAPTTYTNLMAPADVTLAAGSVVLDKGRVLANINDNYQGAGPDLGALELGCPAPAYGPRPEGVDESNEAVGCSLAPMNTTSLSVSPASVTLAASSTQQFSATTVPAGSAVTWQITPARGSISATGLYTAPADAVVGEQITVKAVSAINGAISGTAVVNLTAPVAIALSPASTTLTANQTQQFTATVTGSVNKSVTWILSPSVGTITAAGLYTAPASVTAQTVNVTAVSTADNTRTAIATINLAASQPAQPISVTVSPSSGLVLYGSSQQFTATVLNTANTAVTWSLVNSAGAISPTGVYTAPQYGFGLVVNVKATSVANPAISGTATVRVGWR
jgi:hypothetical protein